MFNEELKTRLVSAAAMAGALSIILSINEWAANGWIFVMSIISLLLLRGGYELVSVVNLPVRFWGILFTFMILSPLLDLYFGFGFEKIFVFLLSVVFFLLSFLVSRREEKDSLSEIHFDISQGFLIFWLFGLGGVSLLMSSLYASTYQWIFFIALVAFGDSSAYFAGKKLGKRKFSPLISPGKTFEGAFAHLGASLIIALCALPFSFEN